MYKWFMWSVRLQKYLPIPGLFPYSRGSCPACILDGLFGKLLPACFSIPMFNKHNAVKP